MLSENAHEDIIQRSYDICNYLTKTSHFNNELSLYLCHKIKPNQTKHTHTQIYTHIYTHIYSHLDLLWRHTIGRPDSVLEVVFETICKLLSQLKFPQLEFLLKNFLEIPFGNMSHTHTQKRTNNFFF